MHAKSNDAYERLAAYIGRMVHFSPEEMEFFTRDMVLRSHKKGFHLLQEGQVAGHLYFIHKGLLRNVSTKPDGSEFTQFFSLENTFVTEYASFLHQKPAIFGIQCIEDSEVIEIPKRSIDEGYLHVREGNKLGRLIAEYYFTMTTQHSHERQTLSLLEQYELLEQKFPGIKQRVPQHMLASYLGISSVHLSRIKAQALRRSI